MTKGWRLIMKNQQTVLTNEERLALEKKKRMMKPNVSWKLFNMLANNTICGCSKEEIMAANKDKMACGCIIAPSSYREDANDLIMKETGAIDLADNISELIEKLMNELLIDHEKGYM
jgi:hypothetical protein